MPLKLVSCDPVDVIPESRIVIVPRWLVRVIPSALAAIGNTSANNAKPNTTRFICCLHRIEVIHSRLGGRGYRTTKVNR